MPGGRSSQITILALLTTRHTMDSSCTRPSAQKHLEAGQSFTTPAGTCVIVTIPHFFERAAPPLPHNLDVDRVVKTLRTSRRSPHKGITKHGRWKGFAQDPKVASRPEKDSFHNISVAVEEIVKASKLSGKKIRPLLHFESNANCEPVYSRRDDNTLPDAYLYCGSDAYWHSIAVCGEYRKDDGQDEVNNVSPFWKSFCIGARSNDVTERQEGDDEHVELHARRPSASLCPRLHYRERQHEVMVLRSFSSHCLRIFQLHHGKC